eukprot:10815165-Lingulodinium_polyedra.AAC.1
MFVKQLGCVLGIRRAVLAQHDVSPVPGQITCLAPRYMEGMERMYSDLARVIRYVGPTPFRPEGVGITGFTQELSKPFYCFREPVGRGAYPEESGG